MAYPYGSLDTSKANATVLLDDHAPHHDVLASALNDLLSELGPNPSGTFGDLTTRLSSGGAGAELTANKNQVSGYMGLDTGQAATENLMPPSRRVALSHRVATQAFAKSATILCKEAWITDSMGHTGATAPETTSCVARYEQEMHRTYNKKDRTVGHCPIELWTTTLGVDSPGIHWDSVPAGQHVVRGGNLANKQINAGQTASNTRNGTGITVFYTALRTGGAVLTVDINGVGATTVAAGSNGVNTSSFGGAGVLNVAAVPAIASSILTPASGSIVGYILVATAGTDALISYTGVTGTTYTGCTTVSGGGIMSTGGSVKTAITTIDGTVAASPGYDAGRSVFFPSPTLLLFGPLHLTLTHSGTGTTAEVEGGYWHNFNADLTGQRGFALYKLGLSGESLASACTTASYQQWIKNQQPQIVTIMLGCNDGQAAGPPGGTAATVATNLGTMITNIRAQYVNAGMPCIRYIFQWKWSFGTCPTDWLTNYRSALRQKCIDNDVIFYDMHEAAGTTVSAGAAQQSFDGLHPDDTGHTIVGQMMSHYSTKPAVTRPAFLDLTYGNWQPVSSLSGFLAMKSPSSVQFLLYIDNGAATTNGTQLGAVHFGGATDNQGNMSLLAASVRGVAEENWTPSTYKAGVRFSSTPSGGGFASDGAGLTGDGTFFAGGGLPSTAQFVVDPAGMTSAPRFALSGRTTLVGADYATTAALPACTYANGAAGVGATLTGNANGALATQDGQTPAQGDIVLVKNQAAMFQNGPYNLTQLGDGSHPFILTRHPAADTAADLADGVEVHVSTGNYLAGNRGSVWLIPAGAYTMGTTSIIPDPVAKRGGTSPGGVWLGPERLEYVVFDDFDRFSAANGATGTAAYPGSQFVFYSNGGAVTQVSQTNGAGGENAFTSHGVLALEKGTSTTGAVSLLGVNILQFDTGKRFEMFARFRPPTLSDGTNTFSWKFGMMDLVTAPATAPQNGVWFQGRSVTNVEAVCMTATATNGTSPNGVDTGFAPATGYRAYRILCPGDGTALFYVNEALIGAGAISDHLPNGAALFMGFTLVATAGASDRQINIDAAEFVVPSTRGNMALP